MTTVMLDDAHLSAIGDALRAKHKTTDTYKPREMAAAIDSIQGSIDIPVFTGDCTSMFTNNRWNWVIDQYGGQIVTEGLTNTNSMFNGSSNLTVIPFDFNCDNSSFREYTYMFSNCNELTEIGDIVDAYIYKANSMFAHCYKLRYLPNFINLKTVKNTNTRFNSMFYNCHSLRAVSEDLLSYLHSDSWTSNSYALTYEGFYNCHALDEIRGLRINANRFVSNSFTRSFDNCNRLKDLIFAVKEDGTPYGLSIRAQTIDLTTVGFGPNSNIQSYNSGIGDGKEVTDDYSYAVLKDDPDWHTELVEYSRYNHDSAVNTINSLPNTSSYVTTSAPNTIKFKSAAGEFTDGGAINTLTEEEIAVATAKGWTVTYVE